ncbi:hypothetical protein EIN_113600 [Entamoeba invadens IP1]|uniref:Uncharacterized protein n=1 Tax=Entamoeba invadens IP1 TaxID=370355 RepID=A0A0A1U174_ENTIV|nr:hypothetical protein EIN_113600 [Entamoeba invadens IP1]ELP86256.1 hypothetical protein EIN_113600 [Entamoeba invadens IP1]|eukprot:XP_004185602.1 hypothetical protein EIN_113600 [Entamoeba invadens IP1]
MRHLVQPPEITTVTQMQQMPLVDPNTYYTNEGVVRFVRELVDQKITSGVETAERIITFLGQHLDIKTKGFCFSLFLSFVMEQANVQQQHAAAFTKILETFASLYLSPQEREEILGATSLRNPDVFHSNLLYFFLIRYKLKLYN